MLFLFGRFNMIQHDSTRKFAARHCCDHLVARASPHSKMKRCLAGGILANQCFEILLPTALISQQDFERIYVTTRMSLFSLSTKPHWSPTSTTLLVAIKCCQHFTMVCYILPSGLLQPPSPVRMPGYIGMTSGCLTQQVRNIARRCGGTQQQLQGVHVRIFCYLLQPPLMVK